MPEGLVEGELGSYFAVVQKASNMDRKGDGSICYSLFDVALDDRAVR